MRKISLGSMATRSLTRIGAPFEIDQTTRDAVIQRTGIQGQRAVHGRSHRPELAGLLITEGDLLKKKIIAWIKLKRSLQTAS